jgi:cytochrome c-type biogenesis protein CcmE
MPGVTAIDQGVATRVAITVIAFGLMQRQHAPATRYVMVDELLAEGLAHREGQPFEVHGYVGSGSITGDDGGRTFTLTRHGRELRVLFVGPVPDAFRDQAEVVVAGELVSRGGEPVLVGDRLLMKCAIRYGDDPAARRPLRYQ